MMLVIDFGSQVAHLIARRLRGIGIYSRLAPPGIKISEITAFKPKGIILSGGPRSVYDTNAFKIDPKILKLKIPILGICYGHQLLAQMLGAKVIPSNREYGKEFLILKPGKSELFKGLNKKEQVWASHSDSILTAPPGFKVIGTTTECKTAAFENRKEKIYGCQFHPEVEHTKCGTKILTNFANICKENKDYSIKGLDKKLVSDIKAKVGNSAVIMGVSGGVDSLVASVLVNKATPNLYCMFVDNGLIRKDDLSEVTELYKTMKFPHFEIVDASKLFLGRLKGIISPETKRKIIGKTFIDVFERKLKDLKSKHHDISFLGQGTIYPDRIESAKASVQASVIKTHHNVGGLPKRMKLKLIEPLKDLYKDEVRELGLQIGIKKTYLDRHPFPGPGLAVRIVGAVTRERVEILRKADAIFIEELKKTGNYHKSWQAFAALLNVKAVGVMGDTRVLGYVIALRAVTSQDAMTADWTRLPAEFLEKVSSQITKNVTGVTRVVYDITQKPPGTIEFE